MTILTGPMQAPLSGGEPKQLVVLLHGYGSDGNDLIGLAPALAEVAPDALFVAPNAPEPCTGVPYGYQWFRIAFDGDRVASRQAGLETARPVLEAYLAELWQATGLGSAQTILGGFSQGAMMALHTGVMIQPPLLGIVAVAGAFVPPAGYDAPDHQRAPVCVVHGDMDGVVPYAMGESAARQLEAAGYRVQFHRARGVAHGISPDGLGFIAGFLRERIVLG